MGRPSKDFRFGFTLISLHENWSFLGANRRQDDAHPGEPPSHHGSGLCPFLAKFEKCTFFQKPLRISGTPDKVEQAKRIIESLLTSDGNNQPNLQQTLRAAGGGGGGGGIKSIGEVIVPRTSVGIIIGKGGDTIKRLAAETGAKIQFKPDG